MRDLHTHFASYAHLSLPTLYTFDCNKLELEWNVRNVGETLKLSLSTELDLAFRSIIFQH